jgi:hypothetical protein
MARVLAAPAAPRVLVDRPAHLSWSQVAKLATGISEYGCPAQWGYSYRLGLPFVSSPAIATGTAIDAGLNAFFAARMAGKDLAEATSLADDACSAGWRKAVDTGNFDEPLSPEKDAAYLLTARNGLAVAITAHQDVIPAALQTRHTYTVRSLDGTRIREVIGFSDRIDQDGTIVDHKASGSVRWDGDGVWHEDWIRERRGQLATYYVSRLAEQARGEALVAPVIPRGRLTVIYCSLRLKTPQVRSLDIDLTDEDVERVLAAVREADVLAAGEHLPVRPGKSCGFCSFVARCRDDQAARCLPFTALTGVPEPL